MHPAWPGGAESSQVGHAGPPWGQASGPPASCFHGQSLGSASARRPRGPWREVAWTPSVLTPFCGPCELLHVSPPPLATAWSHPLPPAPPAPPPHRRPALGAAAKRKRLGHAPAAVLWGPIAPQACAWEWPARPALGVSMPPPVAPPACLSPALASDLPELDGVQLAPGPTRRPYHPDLQWEAFPCLLWLEKRLGWGTPSVWAMRGSGTSLQTQRRWGPVRAFLHLWASPLGTRSPGLPPPGSGLVSGFLNDAGPGEAAHPPPRPR